MGGCKRETKRKPCVTQGITTAEKWNSSIENPSTVPQKHGYIDYINSDKKSSCEKLVITMILSSNKMFQWKLAVLHLIDASPMLVIVTLLVRINSNCLTEIHLYPNATQPKMQHFLGYTKKDTKPASG